MELNLVGKTVTQALAELRQALAETDEAQLTVKTDNETVKLNLYNHVHKLGLRCTSDRQGAYFFLHLKLDNPPRRPALPTAPSAPRPNQVEPTAFPIGHLGGPKTAKIDTTLKPRRRSLLEQPDDFQGLSEERPRPSAGPVAAVNPVASATPRSALPPERPGPNVDQPAAKASHTPGEARTRWLFIQNDQIGSRDATLGITLLEELLDQQDPKTVAGIYLIHRGVRILDPLYVDGRLLRAVLRRGVKLIACPTSVAFYQLSGRVSTPMLSLTKVLELTAGSELIWI